MTALTLFTEGIALGQATFMELDQRGNKWRSRNVPAYIRQNLWRAYYLTENNGEAELYIIRPPDDHNDKVHFIRWEPPS